MMVMIIIIFRHGGGGAAGDDDEADDDEGTGDAEDVHDIAGGDGHAGGTVLLLVFSRVCWVFGR